MTLGLRVSTLMDQRVALQERTVTEDAHHVPRETWATQDTVWGHLKHLSASERVEMEREEHPYDMRCRIDGNDYAADGNRAIIGSETYTIVGFDESGTQYELKLARVTR